MNSANEGILVYDRALNVTAANLAAERILRLPLDRILGAPGFTSLLPCVREDGSPLPGTDRPTRRTVRAGQALSAIVVGIKRPEGGMTWLSVNTGFLRRPGEQQHYGMVSTFTDITARREAEEALRQSEERFRRTFELADSGLSPCRPRRALPAREPAACARSSATASASCAALTVKDVSHPDDRDLADAPRARVLSGELDSARLEKRYTARTAG